MNNHEKINYSSIKSKRDLAAELPEGLLVNNNWLNNKGFKRPLVDYYVRSGKLEAVVRGVYRRPGPPLKWQHVVYSLQAMGFSVHVGGRSALDHQGLAHYLPLGHETVHLYSEARLPGWLSLVDVGVAFTTHHKSLFSSNDETLGKTSVPFGAWDWPVNYATRERALLEYLDDLPNAAEWELADRYMEGAATFRPKLLMLLLQACCRVKTKRLFQWLAERHHHAWFKQLDSDVLNLGSGKRVIAKGGKLDSKYQITVPTEYVNGENFDGSEQPLF